MEKRTGTYTKKVTLKSGEVKVMTYNKTYTTKTANKRIGKTKLRDRIIACNDETKIKQIEEFMDSIGV